MSLIVASEAARKIRVAEIVLVCAPSDPKVGKDVLVISRENRIGGHVDVCGSGLKYRGVFLLVVVPDGCRNLLSCLIAARILDLQRLDSLLLDEGQCYWYPAECHGPVDRSL